MLDPLISLSFSVQSNRGVYAALLGSGVSRSARIPTGWEIVLELVRKVAKLKGADCEPDPAAWYLDEFGKEPDYGELLDAVARTPDERQALLRSYFEPNDEEREEGAKMPTKAHRAIAKLVSGGYIRLIVTTNFDRLMERALEDEGIAPVVVSGPDQLAGLPPLAHLGCCVVKVHGDYLDTRIRNTPTELATYSPEMNCFLDRVFDEFGLVVCGWSADWDVALRACIERAPSRRYSMYWGYRGSLGSAAHGLIKLRSGLALPIDGADSFFDQLQANVQSIEEFNKPHPLSKGIAVASAKRFLSDPVHRIRLSDLIENLGRDLAAQLTTGPFADTSTTFNGESLTKRIKTYESMASTLISVAATCGKWGDARVARLLRGTLERVYACRKRDGLVAWLDFQNYPATLIAYATLLGASLSENLVAMSDIFNGNARQHNDDLAFAVVFPPACFLQDPQGWGRLLNGMDRRYAPVNDWMQNALSDALGDQFVSKEDFERHFDWVEMVLALACHRRRGASEYGDWFPPGSFGHRTRGREAVAMRIRASLDSDGNDSPYVASGLFGRTVDECKTELEGLEAFSRKLGWGW